MFAQALQIIGRIDILLNNASGSGPIAPVAEMDMETWIQCMHINLVGAMYCLQEAAQIMRGTEVWLNNQYVFAYGHSRLSHAVSLCRQ